MKTLGRLKDYTSINVVQGDFSVSADPDVMLTTVLGSCVAACLYDPVARVGGMNHFLLPGQRSDCNESMSYGLNAMELLINTMLKQGGKRSRFQAKLFGGGNMQQGFSDIGRKNAAFATDFLSCEGIPCMAQSLGGLTARRVRFWPTTGKAQVRVLKDSNIVETIPVKKRAIVPAAASDVELF